MASYLDSLSVSQVNDLCNDVLANTEWTKGPCYKKKMYVAGPWFDTKAKRIMYTIKKIVEYTPGCAYDIYFPMDHTKSSPKETFNDNCENIKDADLVVALVSRKDSGTAFEIGYANALKKPIIFVVIDYLDSQSKTNIMLSFAAKHVIDIRDFQKLICKQSYNHYDITDDWEGKE